MDAFHITYDAEVDAAYIRLLPSSPGQVDHSVDATVRDDLLPITIDVTADGRLVGIEVLNASQLLDASTLARATDE